MFNQNRARYLPFQSSLTEFCRLWEVFWYIFWFKNFMQKRWKSYTNGCRKWHSKDSLPINVLYKVMNPQMKQLLIFNSRYPYNAQFIEKYPHLDFSSFFRNEVRMFLHFLPWWRGTWNPVNHLPSLLHSPPTHPPPLPCTLEHSSHNLVW